MRIIAVFTLFLVCLFLLLYTSGYMIGYVTRVVDGDTFIMNKTIVRIWGVDAAESKDLKINHPKNALETLILHNMLLCKKKSGDKYKRIVAQCIDISGNDIAELMIKKGMVKDSPHYSKGYYNGKTKRYAPKDRGHNT